LASQVIGNEELSVEEVSRLTQQLGQMEKLFRTLDNQVGKIENEIQGIMVKQKE